MTIETERLLFRPWREEDAEVLYEYAKDPRVGPAAGWKPHESVEESREIIRTVLTQGENYALVLKELGHPVGCVGLMTPSLHERERDEADGIKGITVGYWLGVPFWGRGLMPEAVEALLEYCFQTLGCGRVWCGYFDGNEKSKRVQEKCRFRYHHTNRSIALADGVIRTEQVSCLSRERWEQRAAAHTSAAHGESEDCLLPAGM